MYMYLECMHAHMCICLAGSISSSLDNDSLDARDLVHITSLNRPTIGPTLSPIYVPKSNISIFKSV